MSLASKAKTKSSKPEEKSNVGLWLIVGGVVLVALVVLVLFLNNRQTTPTATALADVPAEWIDGDKLGSPDAPVVISMYEDFLCPACQQWTAQVKPQLVEQFVKTGQVRLEFNQFPLQQHNPGAIMASQASLCAADQNLFWPYHDRVFQAAASRGQAGTTFEALLGDAGEVGLDEEAMRSCMTNLTHQQTVVDSMNRVAQLGLSSTPSILINDQLMANPFNYNELVAAIGTTE
ncbi:MAG: DsbA family protein [Caldilineaceae bacterium]